MKHKHGEKWTSERTEKARVMYEVDGRSTQQISENLGGVTRNAVIGVVHRKGWRKNSIAISVKPRTTGMANPLAAGLRPNGI